MTENTIARGCLIMGLLVCASFVQADNPQSVSFAELYSNPFGTVKEKGEARTLVASIENGATKARFATEPTMKQAQLVRIGELLEGVAEGDRIEFISNLLFRDGVVVSAYVAPLKNSLSGDEIGAVMKTFDIPKGTPLMKIAREPGQRPQMIRLKELLKDVPTSAQKSFLDSITFRNGIVVSAYIGELKKVVGKSELEKILSVLYPPVQPAPPASPKGLCGNGWCADSVCKAVGDPGWQCMPERDQSCSTQCKDPDR